MEIEFKLNKDFERTLNSLRTEFGEDFEYLNGIHPSQLDYSEFIDKFVQNDTLADTTVDPNANANHRDIRSFMTEKGKSSDKLFGLNKIFLEIKKKWGIKTAKEWLRQEYTKGFYLNDSHTASYFPYSYKGSEIIVVYYKGIKLLTSFEQLYDIVTEDEEVLSEKDNAYCKYAQDLYIEDLVDNNIVKTKVIRVIKKPKTRDYRFIKTANGFSQIVTDNHPMITNRGDVHAKDLILKEDKITTLSTPTWDGNIDTLYITDYLYDGISKDSEVVFNGNIINKNEFETCRLDGQVYVRKHSTNGKKQINSTVPVFNKLSLTKEFGYIIGLTITDGSYNSRIENCNYGKINIKQKPGNVSRRLENCLQKCNILYTVNKEEGINVYTLTSETLSIAIKGSILSCNIGKDKKFNPNIINYNKDFISGVLGGFIDGDGTTSYKENLDRHLDSFSAFSSSRTTYNQFVYMLRCFGYLPKAHVPEDDSFFRLSSRVYLDRYYKDIFSIKIENNISPWITEEDSLSKVRNGYNNSDDSAYIFVNKVLASKDEYVYDISTETHHFICNQILSHNCWANDLTRVATEGLFFLNKYNNQPPKHLTTYFDDVIEFVSFLSNRQSGAVGLPNVLIWAYYFWNKDVESGHFMKDPDYYLRQCFQKFIYRLNQPFLRIDQCAFTNVSIFDRKYLESLFGGMEFPDGTFAIDCIEELIDLQKVFMEVVSDIRSEQMFTFPVLTYSLLYIDGKFQDEDFARWCSDHNVKWSDSNFFISDNVGVLSNCCRLLSDTKKLDVFINSIGGTALSVGSCRVSTINLVRIAYEAKGNISKYIKILKDRVLLDCKALYSMRHIIKRNIEKGLLPNYQDGAVELDKQFCTIGILGLYEVMDLFGFINTDEFGNKSYSDEAVNFGTEILKTINEVKDDFECDFSFNIESIPAENCAGTICTADNILFEQDKYYIYANQWIPLKEKCTIEEKCRLGNIFDKMCGGGCIAHINIEGRFPTKDVAWEMLNYVASHGVIYSAFNTKISVCEEGHSFIGTTNCPRCGNPVVDKFTRVVGFYTPVSSYQKIRKREFDERKWYNVMEKDFIV